MRAIDLADMAEGEQVEDSVKDVWTKKNGRWQCFDANLSGESLIHVWGPIEKVEPV